MKLNKRAFGFTLLEMILVLAIMSTVLLMIAGYSTQRFDQFRRDKAALQMQQVLNAGLAYYAATGNWPASLATLQPNYLPATFNPPWPGSSYTVSTPTPPTYFQVSVTVGGGGSTASRNATASTIAGMLPGGSSSSATVSAQVAIPGENTNNARSVNFANLYHNGGCVPTPNCPTGMTAEIFATPVSVAGMNDSGQTTLYPITSFTAYATGDGTSSSPPACSGGSGTAPTCTGNSWRVCEQVITTSGDVATTNSSWGRYANILAITRCMPSSAPGEPSGSTMSVYQ